MKTNIKMKIPGFHGYSVEFSPHFENELLLCGGSNFGISGMNSRFRVKLTSLLKFNVLGNGSWFKLNISQNDTLNIVDEASIEDVITDISYCPHENGIVAFGCGNGNLILHKLTENIVIKAHTHDISATDWSRNILTTSWDGTMRLVRIGQNNHATSSKLGALYLVIFPSLA